MRDFKGLKSKSAMNLFISSRQAEVDGQF